MYKKVLSTALAMSVLVASMPAYAAFGQKSSSSRSSYSSPSRSSSSYSAPRSSSSRSSSSQSSFGSGKSMGMTRSSVTDTVRAPSRSVPSAPSTPSYNTNRSSGSSVPSYNRDSNYNRGYDNNSYGGGYSNGNRSVPTYNNNRAYTNNSPRFGTGALIGAAVAGGLVGYMLHSNSNGSTYFTNPAQPNVAFDSNGNQLASVPSGDYQPVGKVGPDARIQGLNGETNTSVYNATNSASSSNSSVRAAQTSDSGSWGWLWAALGLMVVGGVLYFIMRRKEDPLGKSLSKNAPKSVPPTQKSIFTADFKDTKNASQTFTVDPAAQIASEKDTFFSNFQKNNRPSKIDWIEDNTEPMMFDAVKDFVLDSDDRRDITVQSLESKVIDVSEENGVLLASVHYKGIVLDDESVSNINEVWHFKHDGYKWKVAGIEQV